MLWQLRCRLNEGLMDGGNKYKFNLHVCLLNMCPKYICFHIFFYYQRWGAKTCQTARTKRQVVAVG